VLDFKSSLLGAATAALGDTPDGTVLLQPVAIAYTRIHGMAMGRQHRTIASWPGDVGIGPHLIGILREGGIDVDISFGPALAFDRSTNRKTATQSLRSVVRDMLSARLRGR
jgi:lyso-ornithine lipid O-acyltransferase